MDSVTAHEQHVKRQTDTFILGTLRAALDAGVPVAITECPSHGRGTTTHYATRRIHRLAYEPHRGDVAVMKNGARIRVKQIREVRYAG